MRIRREAEGLRNRFADLYDFAPIGYFTLDEVGVIREANLAGAVQLGVERESLIGAGFATFLVPDSRPGFAAFCASVLAGGATETSEVPFAAQAGREVWYAQVQGRADAAGAAVFVRLVVTDITDRRRAEDALVESEADARSFFVNMVDACAVCELVVDERGDPVDIRLVDVNPAFERALSLPSGQIVGQTAFMILPTLHHEWLGLFLEVSRQRTFIQVEDAYPALDRWYHLTAYPVRGGGWPWSSATSPSAVRPRPNARGSPRSSGGRTRSCSGSRTWRATTSRSHSETSSRSPSSSSAAARVNSARMRTSTSRSSSRAACACSG